MGLPFTRRVLLPLVAFGPFILVSFGGGLGCTATFTPSNALESVRVLAIQADHPYAAPGATVSLELLAVDARPAKPAPMNVAWITQPCINPPGDDYYACFAAFGAQFRAGVDLTSELVAGTRFSAQVPPDVIATHANAPGTDPYGIEIVFAIACAGHVEYRPLLAPGAAASASPNAVPFGCFDSNEKALGPDDFVFSYATIYSFSDRTNDNPVVDHLTFGGQTVDVPAGITVSRCTAASQADCPTSPVDTVVPASSQEEDPGTLDADGNPLKEEIWVDYYATGAQLQNDVEVLYDPLTGAVSGTGDGLSAPQAAGDQQLWAVVHDTRGGVAWLAVPVHAR